MSITRMSNLAAQRATPNDTLESRTNNGEVQGALDKIAAFIPSEVIGAYVAVTGILLPDTASVKWIIFAVCVALIPVLTLLANALAKKNGLTPPSGKTTVYIILIAVVAFGAWGLALPDNPLAGEYEDASRLGGVAALLLAIVLPQVGELLGITEKKG